MRGLMNIIKYNILQNCQAKSSHDVDDTLFNAIYSFNETSWHRIKAKAKAEKLANMCSDKRKRRKRKVTDTKRQQVNEHTLRVRRECAKGERQV